MKFLISLVAFLVLTIYFHDCFISLITGTFFILEILLFFSFLFNPKREKSDCSVDNTVWLENANNDNLYSSDKAPKRFAVINIASLLVNFTDIQYYALESLKNSYIDSNFPDEISALLDRKAFCTYCLSEDLIRFSTPEEDKCLIKVQECKEYLKKASLKVSGNKKELIQRISDFNPTYFGNQHYIITDKGQQLLKNHRTLRKGTSTPAKLSLDQKMQKYSVSYNEFSALKTQIPFSASENDIIWGILNQKVVSNSCISNLSALRDTYLSMALLAEDECNYEQSLEFFIVTICFDVNGHLTDERPQLIQWISNRVFYLRAYYDMNIPTVAYSKCHADKPYFSVNTFTSLIESIISSSAQLSYAECEQLLASFL